MLLLECGKRNRVMLFKKVIETKPLIEGENFGATSEDKVLSGVDPLVLRGFKKRRNPTAEHTGSFEEINAVSLREGGFCGGNTCQASTDDAYCVLRFTQGVF